MNNQGRKTPPTAPAQKVLPEAPADFDKASEREPQDEVILETFPATDAVAPFIPEQGVVLDGTEVESITGPDAGVEQAGTSAPEQIDPGADGAPLI